MWVALPEIGTAIHSSLGYKVYVEIKWSVSYKLCNTTVNTWYALNICYISPTNTLLFNQCFDAGITCPIL